MPKQLSGQTLTQLKATRCREVRLWFPLPVTAENGSQPLKPLCEKGCVRVAGLTQSGRAEKITCYMAVPPDVRRRWCNGSSAT
jgi:hypothetical protein